VFITLLKIKYLISTIIIICAAIMTIQSAYAAPVLSVEPANIEVLPGDNFTLDIMVDPDGTEVLAAQYELYFDNTLLNVLEQNKGTILSHDGTDTLIINRFNNTIGKVEYGETRIETTSGTIIKGVLSSITFQALKPGICDLNPSNVILANTDAKAIPDVWINNGSVKINNTVTPGLELSISADPTTVTVGVSTDVTFMVTNGSTPVEGVDITLTGCADGSDTTNATGVAVISVNATNEGTITATASKDDYTSADTILTAKQETGEGVSSSVSIGANILPAIALEVTPGNISFGELSPGETSDVHTLTLKNCGGLDFDITADVTDTANGLFEDGLLLGAEVWSNFSTSITAESSGTTGVSLAVLVDYIGVGSKEGTLVFWAQA